MQNKIDDQLSEMNAGFFGLKDEGEPEDAGEEWFAAAELSFGAMVLADASQVSQTASLFSRVTDSSITQAEQSRKEDQP